MADIAIWSAAECPFAIEYSRRALDEIRIAVAEAFFSLPHGGVEVGGLLVGEWKDRTVSIHGFQPLECEHALGPSFTLSARDREGLAASIAAAQPAGMQIVGWYHSHTRSDLLFSTADSEVHREFFGETWQVALVLRPHALLPMRAGFFFRDAAGVMETRSPYCPFTLEPIDKPTPAPEPAGAAAAPAPSVATSTSSAAAAAPAPAPVETALPKFLDVPAAAPRRWPKVVVSVAAVAGIAGAGYWKRDAWIPSVRALVPTTHAASPQPPAGLGLNTVEIDGQLQIRWNRNSPSIMQSRGGVLKIAGAEPPVEEVRLDRDHLLSGVLTLAGSERVDVTLAVNQPDGHDVREATLFAGKPTEPEPAPADHTEEITKLRADLESEVEHGRKLQKDVDFLGKQLRDQLRVRLLNQAK